MYRCRECGAEFEVKPDFCDCGNDTFEEVFDKIEDVTIAPLRRKTFEEQYPGISEFLQTLDPISVIVFIFCIILSVLALIFIKPDEQEIAESVKSKEAVTKNINVADINSFWNDTPPRQIEMAVHNQETQTIVEKFIDILPKQEPQKTSQTPKQQPQKVQTPKPQPKTTNQTKANKPSSQKPKVSKPAQNVQKTPQQTAKPNSQPKLAQQTQKQPSQANNTAQKPVSNTQQQPSQNTNSQTSVQKVQQVDNSAVIQAQAAAQELKKYKNGLRNTLFSKINFTKVYGNGACIVDFQINSNGKLVNRSFSKQSTNNTLNDEVYSAIINTPVYKVPPSSYNGQTLHFSVKFENGNYEVSLY